MLDPALLRSIVLAVPLGLALLAWTHWPPSRRTRLAALLATLWNVPAILAVDQIARHTGWWTYGAQGGLVLGMPADLLVGWVVLWGTLPALVSSRVPIATLALAAAGLDFVVMPLLSPVVVLGPGWVFGELLALAVALVPSQILARWTRDGTRLEARALLLAVGFGAFVVWLLPALALDWSGRGLGNFLERPRWLRWVLVEFALLAALPGISATWEFAIRGGGTPIPMDPPGLLVTSGVYAYVANPMQISCVLVLVVLGLEISEPLVAAGALVALVYSEGFARWHEEGQLARRFGADWTRYRAQVWRWVPRWRPWTPERGARVYFARSCGVCNSVASWFLARRPAGLEILPAEGHPSRTLALATYDPGDGGVPEEGVAALARALEHLHLGWAMLGWIARLPVVRGLLQLVADRAFGRPARFVAHPAGSVPAQELSWCHACGDRDRRRGPGVPPHPLDEHPGLDGR